jgi:CBS domain-containing protein
MRVRDLMSAPAHTCTTDTDLAAVAKLMWDGDFGFVPVVDTSGNVAGVITDRDICISTATRSQTPQQIAAAHAMSSPTHACMPDDAIRDVLAVMKRFRVRRLPVIDSSGQLQGVISMNDIVLAAAQRGTPPATELVSSLAAICAHRSIEAAAV